MELKTNKREKGGRSSAGIGIALGTAVGVVLGIAVGEKPKRKMTAKLRIAGIS